MAKDPAQMTDEELEEAIANPEIAENIIEVPAPEKKPDEEKKPEDKGETEEADPKKPDETPAPEPKPEDEGDEKPPSRREQLRIQDILAKRQAAAEIKPVQPTAPEVLDYEKTLDADPELIKKLQADREASNRAMYEQGIAQANSIRFHTRLEIDAPKVEAKYPQLDKTSDKFNPALANAVNTMYLSTAGYNDKTDTAANPDLRYAEYVESIFELANEIAGEKTAETTKNIQKQAAQTGLRPSGAGTMKINLNKPPELMTDEELDAVIAATIPSLH